jgi:hypothetical protein
MQQLARVRSVGIAAIRVEAVNAVAINTGLEPGDMWSHRCDGGHHRLGEAPDQGTVAVGSHARRGWDGGLCCCD